MADVATIITQNQSMTVPASQLVKENFKWAFPISKKGRMLRLQVHKLSSFFEAWTGGYYNIELVAGIQCISNTTASSILLASAFLLIAAQLLGKLLQPIKVFLIQLPFSALKPRHQA